MQRENVSSPSGRLTEGMAWQSVRAMASSYLNDLKNSLSSDPQYWCWHQTRRQRRLSLTANCPAQDVADVVDTYREQT
jgi:hypothetical protein